MRPGGVLKPYDAQRLASPSRRAAAFPAPPRRGCRTQAPRGAPNTPLSRRQRGSACPARGGRPQTGGGRRAFPPVPRRATHAPRLGGVRKGPAPTDNAVWRRPSPDTSGPLSDAWSRTSRPSPPPLLRAVLFPTWPGNPRSRDAVDAPASHGRPFVAAPWARREPGTRPGKISFTAAVSARLCRAGSRRDSRRPRPAPDVGPPISMKRALERERGLPTRTIDDSSCQMV